MRRVSFYLLGGLIFCFGLSYGWPVLYGYGIFAFLVLLIVAGYNFYQLSYTPFNLEINVALPPIFTLGDTNTLAVTLKNTGTTGAFIEPIYIMAYSGNKMVLQKGLFKDDLFINPGETLEYFVSYHPKTRGIVYILPLEVSYFVRPYLMRRSVKIGSGWNIKVYPSVLQMKQFNLLFNANMRRIGRSIPIKKVQEGFSYELEQILPFTAGDDARKINWRVSGRKTELMVNRYQSERRRDIYLILDSTRPMMQEGAHSMMIFEYAINTILMLANIILQRGDRCGLMVVGKRVEIKVALGGGQRQLKRIMESLYKLAPTDYEGDFFKIESLVGRKNILLICSHQDQLLGVQSAAFNRLIKLFPTIPILFSKSTSRNFKTIALQASREYLSRRLY